MTENSRNTAICPNCTTEIATVTVTQLQTTHAQTKVTFWTCPECETILAPTRS